MIGTHECRVEPQRASFSGIFESGGGGSSVENPHERGTPTTIRHRHLRSFRKPEPAPLQTSTVGKDRSSPMFRAPIGRPSKRAIRRSGDFQTRRCSGRANRSGSRIPAAYLDRFFERPRVGKECAVVEPKALVPLTMGVIRNTFVDVTASRNLSASLVTSPRLDKARREGPFQRCFWMQTQEKGGQGIIGRRAARRPSASSVPRTSQVTPIPKADPAAAPRK